MRKSCGLRMLLKLQATPMLSFSSELKNKEKQKVSFGGPGRPAGDPQNFIFSASPWGTRRPTRPHTASHARTHATQPQPKPKSISRLAAPPNLQYIDTYKTSLKADWRLGGAANQEIDFGFGCGCVACVRACEAVCGRVGRRVPQG